jgi:divalent metal cation (Fe/Co/Zn/Cd) transporter
LVYKVAFLGILLGDIYHNPIFDGVASLLIGVILSLTAGLLAYESKGLLIGESAAGIIVDEIGRVISAQEALLVHKKVCPQRKRTSNDAHGTSGCVA